MEKIIYYTNSGEFEAEKLLPCPFCGGEPEFITIGNEATKKRKAQIECTKCHVRRTTGAIRNSLEWCGRKAIELWNARWQETSNESAALPLHGVSQQRELLYGFITWHNAKPQKERKDMIYISEVEDFLKP